MKSETVENGKGGVTSAFKERHIKFTVTETHIDLKGQDGRETKYDTFVHLTDTGVLAVVKTSESCTDIHRIIWSQEHGWQTRFLFRVPRVVALIAVDEDRIICDHQVYT